MQWDNRVKGPMGPTGKLRTCTYLFLSPMPKLPVSVLEGRRGFGGSEYYIRPHRGPHTCRPCVILLKLRIRLLKSPLALGPTPWPFPLGVEKGTPLTPCKHKHSNARDTGTQ